MPTRIGPGNVLWCLRETGTDVFEDLLYGLVDHYAVLYMHLALLVSLLGSNYLNEITQVLLCCACLAVWIQGCTTSRLSRTHCRAP